MLTTNSGLTRRRFLEIGAATVGAAAMPFSFGATKSAAAKYTRYNVMSSGGQKALASYAKGVQAMLNLPANHPQNWFRNAFVHLMDCPHGNWWFYVWHRGYVGYFEESIRNLSGDKTFAMPYWDWTTLPRIPDAMFDGVLTPQSMAFEPYTRNLAVFTSFIQPTMQNYWNGLSPAQLTQLKARGYTGFDKVWNDVNGYDPTQSGGVSGNIAYANPCGSRYLTRDNPTFDAKTAHSVSADVVRSGLLPTEFYNSEPTLSFNSAKTPSHNSMPTSSSFCILEGMPHNKVHNYIGGVGPLDPGPYGNMTNFLSPVDPIFFLHHANMDRLWDVWVRKQKSRGLPYLPTGQDLQTLVNEPFLFYVNGNGQQVGTSRAGEYLSTERFDYQYEPGFGEDLVGNTTVQPRTRSQVGSVKGSVRGNVASVNLPSASIKGHLANEFSTSLIAEVTVARPGLNSSTREFDVIVGAPAGVTQVEADSPYYAGTIAFFGPTMKMEGMGGATSDATFAIPLPKAPTAFHNFAAVNSVSLDIRVVPSQGKGGKAPVLRSISVHGI